MASDYGGAYGSQPRRDPQGPYPGQPPYGPPYGGPPRGWVPPPARRTPRRRGLRMLALITLALGGLGLVGFGVAAGLQFLPRKFTAQQRQQIVDWEYSKRWRDLPARSIFPASVSYSAPGVIDDDASLVLSARLVGVAKEVSCASGTDLAAAAALDRAGCAALVRATYVDKTDSFVVTVGAAVLPGAAKAQAAARAIAGAAGAAAVHAVPFAGTPAAAFTDRRRQLSGAVAGGTYVILYTVGYADARPKEPVGGDGYADAEMTSAGLGVAHDVLSLLAAPVHSPHCPGTPGC